MAQKERSEIRQALCKKGFVEEDNDHYFYTLVYNQKKTAIFTKISKGSNYKTIHQALLSLMSKQLKLSNNEFLQLVDCSISGESYIEILKKKDILK